MAAAKRLASSSINWARAAQVCPKTQLDILRATQAKHAAFLNKVHSLPDSLPKIDFEAYKGKTEDATMADRFQKAYEALEIPYPKDKDNMLEQVRAENAAKDKEVKAFVAEKQKQVDEAAKFVKAMDTLPDYADMTSEMYGYYFPELHYDPINRPRKFPFGDLDQHDCDPNTLEYMESYVTYGVVPRNKVIPELDKRRMVALRLGKWLEEDPNVEAHGHYATHVIGRGDKDDASDIKFLDKMYANEAKAVESGSTKAVN